MTALSRAIETTSKANAAKRLGVSTKSLERRVNAGTLTAYKKQGKTGLETHFAVADIEAIEQERSATIIAPKAETGHDATAATKAAPQIVTREQFAAALDRIGDFMQATTNQIAALTGQVLERKALPGATTQDATAKTPAPSVAVESKVFLTLREAAALSGLSLSHLDAAIKAKKMKAITPAHVRGRRIRRTDLNDYLKKL